MGGGGTKPPTGGGETAGSAGATWVPAGISDSVERLAGKETGPGSVSRTDSYRERPEA